MTDEPQNQEEEKLDNAEPAKSEAEEYKANWQRALADYRNLQKEVSTMRSQWAQMSEENILQDFIPVYENFKKAFSAVTDEKGDGEQQWKSWKQGIEYIMKQFGDILKLYKVEPIKTVGEKFDPNLHEAIGEEEGEEPGVVLKEVEGGYKMGGRVIKPARVIISK